MLTSRKRAREEDEEDLHEYAPDTKRSTLPFRASPNIRHIRPLCQSRSRPPPLFTQTVTPADSSEEENSPPFQSTEPAYQQYHSTNSISSTLQDQSLDTDMDMTDSLPLISPRQWDHVTHFSSPAASPCTMEFQPSEPKESQNNATGGRLPTPIWGHFQRSIDAKMDMGGNPENHRSRLQQVIEYENQMRGRRLPTPIDEDEAMDTPTAMSGDLMDLHLGGHSRRGGVDYTHRHSENDVAYQSISDTLSGSADYGPPPPRKLSFSMGPKANCDSCFRRIPGHSNHITWT